jgi:ferredoxin
VHLYSTALYVSLENFNSSAKVEIEHENGTTILDVDEGTTILDAALETGLELSHDCKMGVCMTCPARLVIDCLHANTIHGNALQ